VVDGAGTHSGTLAAIGCECVPGDDHDAVRGAYVHVRGAHRHEAPGEKLPAQDLQVGAHE